MKNLKVKERYIGATTEVRGLGRITIQENHSEILARAGRFELLEGHKGAKQLQPVEEKKLEDLSIAKLRSMAKHLDGFSKTLKKTELIELINASTSTEHGQ